MADALLSNGMTQEYEVPKKPLYVMDDDLWLTQSSDLSTYVADSLSENIMLVTNGYIGLRCKTETETAEIQNEVLLHGVHHCIKRRGNTVDVCDIPCSVSIDFLVDGSSGNLFHPPSSRLSLRHGTFHRSCQGIMNSEGTLVFDCDYYHGVSSTEPSLWSAEVYYHHFSGFPAQVTPVLPSVENESNPLSSDEFLHLSSRNALHPYSPRSSMELDGVRRSDIEAMRKDDVRGGGKDVDSSCPSQSSHSPERFQITCVVSLTIPKQHWRVKQVQQPTAQVVQQSLTSSCMVGNAIEVECYVEGSAFSSKEDGNTLSVAPDAEKQILKERGGDEVGKQSFGDRFTGTQSGSGSTTLRSDGFPSAVGSVSAPDDPDVLTELFHGFLPTSSALDAVEGDAEEENKVFKMQRRFTFWYDEADPFERVVLRLSCSHLLLSSSSSSSSPCGMDGSSPPSPILTSSHPPFTFFNEMHQATEAGFEQFLRTCDVQLVLEDEPRERTQLALRYNSLRMYLLSRSVRHGIPLRLGGNKDGMLFNLGNYLYYGLYFSFTQPSASLSLLLGLYDLLNKARENARNLAIEAGAIFPLRTIRGGECMNVDSTTCFVHVNAEIGNLIHLYFMVVGEPPPVPVRLQLLELLLETSRIWLEFGVWMEDQYTFSVRAAMGADMYNRSAWGNFYVSLSAKKHMERALLHFFEQEKLLGARVVNELLTKIQMTREELVSMEGAARGIVLERSVRFPGVFPVHDTFDTLHPWAGKEVTHPLFLNYHPLAVYRSKVVDVPDVLLGIVLYPENFQLSDLKANLEHYLPLCTLDSPESLGIIAICHCRAYENVSKSMSYYRALVHLNLDNTMYCSEEGLNYVSIVGSYLTILFGLGGVTANSGTLCLDPVLPAGVSFCAFSIVWKGARLRVSISPEATLYELVEGSSIRFRHGREAMRIRLHTGFRSFKAALQVSIPRIGLHQEGVFEGAIVLLESVIHNILEYHYVSWHRTFERLFETFRAVHNVHVPPLNPEEFIDKIVYSKEEDTPFTGINQVLRARNIHLELGTPEDAEIVDTLYGLGNANLAEIMDLFQQQPPSINPDILLLLKKLAMSDVPLAVVSYNRNVKLLLELFPELSQVFISSIDGDEAMDVKLRGQPHTDIFLRAAKKIHVIPSRCLVISYNLDRGYAVNDLAQFFMFLDIEDPFVSSRVSPHPYPLLSPEEEEKHRRGNPLICRIHLSSVPKNIEELEDAIQGEC